MFTKGSRGVGKQCGRDTDKGNYFINPLYLFYGANKGTKSFLTGNLNDCFYFGCKKGIGTINNYYWWVGKIVKRGKYEKYNKADDKDL